MIAQTFSNGLYFALDFPLLAAKGIFRSGRGAAGERPLIAGMSNAKPFRELFRLALPRYSHNVYYVKCARRLNQLKQRILEAFQVCIPKALLRLSVFRIDHVTA